MAAITPWERELLASEGLGVGPTPLPAAVVFAPDLTAVQGVFDLVTDALQDAGFDVASTGGGSWHVARLQRGSGFMAEEAGLATGTGELDLDFFVADALGVSTAQRAPQQSAIEVIGLALDAFEAGSAADVF